uniref:Retrotransposon protein, putative, unclassified n=1 Tax=Oryza sativa subsp. japonica TaxID=39947 RepID=Q852F9_ORYSJ|nr:retrotransposon protein, putative, unclassified [Oryza sativa Japonica Group]
MGRDIPASTPLGTGANVGARLPVRSDVTGDRPVTVWSRLIDLPEGLGARQREGPRGVMWHPEAPWLPLRLPRRGGRARL